MAIKRRSKSTIARLRRAEKTMADLLRGRVCPHCHKPLLLVKEFGDRKTSCANCMITLDAKVDAEVAKIARKWQKVNAEHQRLRNRLRRAKGRVDKKYIQEEKEYLNALFREYSADKENYPRFSDVVEGIVEEIERELTRGNFPYIHRSRTWYNNYFSRVKE